MLERFHTLSEQVPTFLWNLMMFAIAILVGILIKFLISRILHFYYNKDNGFSFFKSIIRHLGIPINYFLPLIIINFLMPTMKMGPALYVAIGKVVEIGLIISFSMILIMAIKVMEDYVYQKYDLSKSDNLKERKIRTQLRFVRKLVTALIILITIAIVLLTFESMRKIGAGLLTGVGIGGIIIGFAAQKSLANLLAGFQIAFTQPIRIDDVLVVEGEWGRVEDITLTYVVLCIWDKRRLILPITYFVEKPFQNWTRVSADILGAVFFYLDYTVPLDKIREKFIELLAENKLWDGKVQVMQVTDTKPDTIEIRALMSARNSSDAFDLRCYIRENLITFIQQDFPESLPRNRVELFKDGKGDELYKNQTDKQFPSLKKNESRQI